MRALIRIHGIVAGVWLLAGLLALLPEVGWLRDLSGRSLAERGQLASDPSRSPLSRAGRVELRRRLAAGGPESASPVGDVWRWCYETSRDLPPDARVWLGVPLTSLYYYGSFFWYPARVDVTPEPAIVRDQQSLTRHARTPDRAWLVGHGYTHRVAGGAGGLRLVRLTRDRS